MSVTSVNPTSSSRYVTFDKTQSASKFQVQETKSDNRQPVLLDEGVFGTAFVGEPPVPIKMDKYGIDLWYSGGSKNAGNGRYSISSRALPTTLLTRPMKIQRWPFTESTITVKSTAKSFI